MALAGIAPGATVGTAVTGGTALYNTSYSYTVIDNVARTSTFISGDRGVESGGMVLTADFNIGTLTGSNSELAVNGTITGTNVGGSATATYSFPGASGSVGADLTGQIGSTGVIGAFAGRDGDTVVADGFVGQ